MNLPDVSRCLGMFPPKYGCILISFFGLGSGGCGITGIVMFALVEDAIAAQFGSTSYNANGKKIRTKKQLNPMLKKVVLATIGLTSLLLLVGNGFLLLGMMTSSVGSVVAALWLLLILVSILLVEAMAGPMSCFFMQTACFIKQISIITMVLIYILMTVFIEIWLYFVIIIFNYRKEMM